MPFIKLFFFLSIFNIAFAELPELKTKQALDNIRYITHDGKYTYYQQRSGDLQMATNYENKLVMKQDKGTFYLLSGSDHRKKIIVEIINNYHKQLDFFSLNDLYVINYGDIKPKMIAKGKSPKLHIADTWLSYFHPRTQEIFVQNLNDEKSNFKIKLNNPVNPYFIPEVYMPTPDNVFYTDINKEGFMAIQMYTKSTKTFVTVYKSKFTGMRIDFCSKNDNLFIGEFSYDGVNRGSTIVKVPIYKNDNFKNFTTLYRSDLSDIGHLTCSNEKLYFIKTTAFNDVINSRKSEAVSLNLIDSNISILTNLEYVTNIVEMDGNILIPFRERYYVAEGKNILNQDAINKKKDVPKTSEENVDL